MARRGLALHFLSPETTPDSTDVAVASGETAPWRFGRISSVDRLEKFDWMIERIGTVWKEETRHKEYTPACAVRDCLDLPPKESMR